MDRQPQLMMTPDLLIATGEACYGEYWRTPVAEQLGVADRTVRRWALGTHPIPGDIAGRMLHLVQDRIELLCAAEEHLKKIEITSK